MRRATLAMKPFPKERPRSRKNTVAVYTPPKTKAFEKAVKDAWLERFPADTNPPLEGPVSLFISVSPDDIFIEVEELDEERKSQLRGDLDNYFKAVADALNGVAFKDDKQVYVMTGQKW